MTSVIVRSGANVAAGGRERLSAIVHGLLLVLALLFLSPLLNQVPLACLAAVLIQVGLNLAKPSMIRGQYHLGLSQFIPFAVTIGSVLALDLLKGVIIGMIVGVVFVIRQNILGSVRQSADADGTVRIQLMRDATFLTKPLLMSLLDDLDDNIRLIIDGTGHYVDHDVKEALATFLEDAHTRKIHTHLAGIDLAGIQGGSGH